LRPRSFRSAFLAASVVACLAIPARVEAGGAVLPLAGQAGPSPLDLRVAVATPPTGTTRWSEVTVQGGTRFLWLVPARPGATIGWASAGWLPALEEATAPRIVRPSYATSCNVFTAPERTTPWTVTASKQSSAPYTVLTAADTVRTAATNGGFAITGRKLRITNCNEADMFIVFANVNPDAGYRGITAFIVDRGTPGFTVGKKEDKLGIRASSTCELVFEDCVVPR